MKRFSVLLAVAMLLVFVGQVFAADVVKLKFSHAAPRTSTWHEGAEKFAGIVKEKTGGKFEITIYPLDELSGGNQVAGIELVWRVLTR